MKCELCGKKAKPNQSRISTFTQDERGIVVKRGVIHVGCLKELVDSVRAIGLTIS